MAIWKIAKYAGIITVQYNYHGFFHQQSKHIGTIRISTSPQHCFVPLSMHWWQQQHGSEWIPPQFGSSGFRVSQQQTCESWRIVHVSLTITSFSNMKTPQANIQQLQAQKCFLLNPKEGKAAVIAKMLRILNFPSLREPSGRDSQLKPPVHIHGTDNTLHSASSIFKLHWCCRIVKSCSCRECSLMSLGSNTLRTQHFLERRSKHW